MISRDHLDIRQHVAQRMLERSISVADLLVVLNSGTTIEHYPEDTPFPSQLTLGWWGNGRCTWCGPRRLARASTGRVVIITVYEPNPEEWDNEFRRRRL